MPFGQKYVLNRFNAVKIVVLMQLLVKLQKRNYKTHILLKTQQFVQLVRTLLLDT
jgi:hypothetical protein